MRSFVVDVSDAVGLELTLAAIRSSMPKLRGVFHAAGLLDDALIVNLHAAQIDRVLAPKIEGALLLDRLTSEDPLDLFVMFSSAAALFGNAGQAAYAAANAALDALAERRRREGRAALSVQWGPFASIGLAAAADNRGSRLEDRGMGSFEAKEAWTALEAMLAAATVVTGFVTMDLRRWFDAHPDIAGQPSWEQLRLAAKSGSETTVGHDFRDLLESAPNEERVALAEAKVEEIAGRVLRIDPKTIDRDTPFKSLGLDSLMGLELRNRLEAAFGLKLSPTLLWTYGNARALSAVLIERVLSQQAASSDTMPQEPTSCRPSPVKQMERM